MATLNEQIQNLATQIGTDVKTLVGNQGNLNDLTTTDKANLVVAINELQASLNTIVSEVGAKISDETTTTTTTWSSTKIASEITAKCQETKNAILGGAGDAYDTLQELATLISENKDLIESLETIAANHVRYDTAQELTTEQKAQARTNIGAASADDLTTVRATANTAKTQSDTNTTAIGTLTSLTTTAKGNLVLAINEVKGLSDTAQRTANTAKTSAETAQSNLDAYKLEIGATDTDFVAVYTAARDGE